MESKSQENPDDFIGLIFTYFKEYGTQNAIPLTNNESYTDTFNTNDGSMKYSTHDVTEFELKLMIDHHEEDIGHVSDGYSSNNSTSSSTSVLQNFNEGNFGAKSKDEMSSLLSQTFEMETMSLKRINNSESNYLQYANEPRSKYLLRFPQLYQEFMNSSNLEKLKTLVYDVITENCIFHIQTSPPIVGVDKIYNMQCMTLKTAPDWYVLFSKMNRIKKRIWTLRSKSSGTLPYNFTNMDREKTYWNFVGMPIEKLDEFHQLQKQKYDTLISQKKLIKFERTSKWYFFLNRECSQFDKVMAYHTHLEIFEK